MSDTSAADRAAKSIQEAQEVILSNLYTESGVGSEMLTVPVWQTHFEVIDTGSRFWLVDLLKVPSDKDFIYVSYQLLLGREPDRSSYRDLRQGLLCNRLYRLDAINSIMNSNEFQERQQTVFGVTAIGGMLSLWRVVRRVPVLYRLLHTLFRMLTVPNRTQGLEERLSELEERFETLSLRTIDTIEYIYAQRGVKDYGKDTSNRSK